jgi:hypothetical protein
VHATPMFGGTVKGMFRITFLVDDSTKRQGLATELRALTMAGDTRIVSAFVYAKTVEVFLELGDSAVPRDVAGQLALAFGVDEYEVTSAEPLPTRSPERAVSIARRRLRPAVITQVRVHPDGRTLSVQARHRPYETADHVEVEQSDDAVMIRVLLGSPDDDERDRYVSFAVAFSWMDIVLDRPVGDREIIRDDPDRRPSRSQPAHDEIGREESIESFEAIQSIQSIESDPDNADTDRAGWSTWGPHLI